MTKATYFSDWIIGEHHQESHFFDRYVPSVLQSNWLWSIHKLRSQCCGYFPYSSVRPKSLFWFRSDTETTIVISLTGMYQVSSNEIDCGASINYVHNVAGIFYTVVYDRNHYFGLGPIPKPQFKEKIWLSIVRGIFFIIIGPLIPNLLPHHTT